MECLGKLARAPDVENPKPLLNPRVLYLTHIGLHHYVFDSHTASYHILRYFTSSTHLKPFPFDNVPQDSFPDAFVDYSLISTNGLAEAYHYLLLAFGKPTQNVSD